MKNYRILLGLTFRNRMAGLRLGSWRKDNGKLDFQRILVTVMVALSLLFTAGFMIFVEIKLFAALKMVNQAVLMPALAVLLCMVSTLFLSFFHVLSGLYFSRDTSWMAYLPVKSRTVMAAKMTEIWLGETAFCAAVLLPVCILYGGYLNAGAGYYVRMTLLTLLTPVLPLCVSLVCTSLLARLTALTRHKEAWIYGGSLLMVAGILYLEMTVLPRIPDDADTMYFVTLLLRREGLLNMLAGAFPPVLWAVHGLNGDLWQLLLFAGVSLGLMGAGIALLGGRYLALCVNQTEQGTRGHRRARTSAAWRQRGPLKALYLREWNEIIKTPAYAFNCLSTIILFPLMIVMMSVMNSSMEGGISLSAVYAELGGMLGSIALTDKVLILTGLLAFASFINPAISTAVSREGGRLPISRMIPVSARVQLRAKLLVGLTIDGLAALMAGAVIAVLLPSQMKLFLLALPLALMLSYTLCALALTLDTVRPNLHWVSETQVIKQSLNVMFGMLISLALLAIPAVTAFALLDRGSVLRFGAVTAVLVAECAVAFALLHWVGEKRYATLEDSRT